MKLLVFIVAVIFVMADAKVELPADLKAHLHSTCLKDQNLSEADFNAFDIRGKDPKLMCYVRCLLIQFKMMDENDVVLEDNIKNNLPPVVKNIVLPHLDKCKAQATGTAKCEKAFAFSTCLHMSNPEDWNLV